MFPEEANRGPIAGPCLVAALGERLAAPVVSLYGPTRPEKYAPFARALISLKAQDYGSPRIDAIPLDAVLAAVDRQVAIGPATGGVRDSEQGETDALIGADFGR